MTDHVSAPGLFGLYRALGGKVWTELEKADRLKWHNLADWLNGRIDTLLAEQAHRYQEDLSRLGDERDEAVAQHDRDAETIGTLNGQILEAADALTKAISFEHPTLVGGKGLVSAICALASERDGYVHTVQRYVHTVQRLVAERDEARSLLALAEGVAAALPDPDAQNPEHCQFAAELSAQLPPTGPNEDWEWTTAHRGLTARQWAERAKSLEAAQSAEAQRDREIEAVATALGWRGTEYHDVVEKVIDALDAARAEAGQ